MPRSGVSRPGIQLRTEALSLTNCQHTADSSNLQNGLGYASPSTFSHVFTLKNQHPFHKPSIYSPMVRYRWNRIALVIYFFTLTVDVNEINYALQCVCVCAFFFFFCCSLVFDQLID